MNMRERVAPKIMYEDDLADKLKVVLQELSDVMKARKDQIEDNILPLVV